MREILFRGKCITDNTWVYGFLFITRKGKYNIKWYDPHYGSSKTSEVYPESIGQYTGQLDSVGDRIFENDIVYVLSEDEYATIIWDEEESRFVIQFDSWSSDFSHFYGHECEVIDNIFDCKERDNHGRL